MIPNRLSALAGNTAIHRQLTQGHLSHAYIISGPPGSGRHTLANLIAQMLVCSAPEGQRPCGHCSNCKKAAAHIHPDIISVPALMENGKRLNPARAREYHSDAYIAPNEARRKVYLFEQAGELSEAVQNVLLKLIEEGPPYAAFLLVVEHSGQLLPTVCSRCEELKLTPVSQEEALAFLSQRYPNRAPEELQRAAAQCGGILGRAVEELEHGLAESEGLPLAVEFCTALANRKETELAAFMAQNEKRSREELIAMGHQCRVLLHSALLLSVGQPAQSEEPVCKALSGLPKRALLRLDSLMNEAIDRLEGVAGSGHLLGWLAVSCAEILNEI